MSTTQPAADTGRQQRAEHVAAAIHSAAMEGQQVTDATRADMDDYVTGDITAAQLVARVQARYRA